MNRTIKVPKTLYRTGTSEIGEDGSIKLSISSDAPYLRYDLRRGEEYYEVLDHSPSGMDTTRLKAGAALLFNHQRDIQLGTINSPELENGKCYVSGRMSKAPDVESYRIRVQEGILKDCSVGYSVSEEGEEIDERGGVPVIRFKWSPHEASLVTIAADISVGVEKQRALDYVAGIDTDGIETTDIEILSKINLAPVRENENNNSQQRETRTTEKPNMPEPTATLPEAPDITVVERARDEMQLKRVADIFALSRHFAENGLGGQKIDTSNLAQEFITNGKSCAEFQDAVVRGSNFKPVKIVADNPESAKVGMDQKDLERYSIVRAINRISNKQPLDGVERAAHDAHVKLTGREVQGSGFFIPHDVMAFDRSGASDRMRALFTNVYSAAGALVNTDLLAGSMIELLRNKLAVVKMGARTLGGLTGNVAIPLQSGGATASWLAENATISESTQAVGQLGLTPHRLSAMTAYSYQLLTQSSVDVENFVREDLMRVLAIAKDLAAIAGTGVSGQPLGILNTTNLSTSVTFTNAQTMLYVDALAFENNVALNNADMGKLGYLTTPTVRKNAKNVAELTGGNAVPIWKNDMVNGFQAFATNQVPTATSVIFGNWDDLILASWAGMQVIVNPYSLDTVGQVRITMQELCDNGLRHPKSFSVSTN